MTRKQKKMLVRIIIAALAAAILLIFSPKGHLGIGLWLAVYILIGYDILYKAVRGIFSLQLFDESFLMAIATVGAIALTFMGRGEMLEAVAVMLFYQIGELFQSYAIGKSRKSIGALMDIRPDKVSIIREGKIVQVSPEEIEIGSEILLCAGERLAIDGIIVEGSSALDTKALTGESLPRNVSVGDKIESGCVNAGGLLKIKTTHAFGESTASRILELVENASSNKSRSEGFITKFAKIYTPAVCICALLLALLPPIALLLIGSSPNWSEWLYRALTFLVISCPCALVISIPLTFFAGLGGASRKGILIKGSNYVEALSKVQCVALDKTGTLTNGSFEISRIITDGIDESTLLEYAALAESGSSHPIAKSLVAACSERLDTNRVQSICEYGGKGVSAVVDKKFVLAGNSTFMEEKGIFLPSLDLSAGCVYVAIDGSYCGCIIIADIIKEDSAAAVSQMRMAGVKNVVMLTGDSDTVANRVAAQVGVDKAYSHLLPDGKVAVLEELLATGQVTAFVGDGINDAPVLARAHVGIAMGGIGSDAAIEAADAVIMDDNPRHIATAIKISKKCMRIVRQNIILSLCVKLACLALGAFGIANMWLAVFADVGIMVLAVLNAIRALNTRKI